MEKFELLARFNIKLLELKQELNVELETAQIKLGVLNVVGKPQNEYTKEEYAERLNKLPKNRLKNTALFKMGLRDKELDQILMEEEKRVQEEIVGEYNEKVEYYDNLIALLAGNGELLDFDNLLSVFDVVNKDEEFTEEDLSYLLTLLIRTNAINNDYKIGSFEITDDDLSNVDPEKLLYISDFYNMNNYNFNGAKKR